MKRDKNYRRFVDSEAEYSKDAIERFEERLKSMNRYN